MYAFEISNRILTEKEQDIFEDHLSLYGLDNGIWEVFSSLFKSGLEHTKPLLLRIFKNSELFGAIIITKCSRYGKALFDNKFLSWVMNRLSIPYYQWIKFGCCMDMMSNPGFVKEPEKSDEVFRAAIHFLKNHSILTIISDYTENSGLYNGFAILPSLPHAIIDCSNMGSIHDYLKDFKNIKRKLRVFEIKGGNYIRVDQNLNKEQLTFLRKCILSTISGLISKCRNNNQQYSD
jgi:hypothetical protein